MFKACMFGHLSVCQWLFEVGAAGDITKADRRYGSTPMHRACQNNRLAVCRWLVFNGALNTPEGAQAATGGNDAHVDQAVVERDTDIPVYYLQNIRPALLAWASNVVAVHDKFFHVVLRASVVLPAAHQRISPHRRCHLPRLPRVILERIGSMLSVEVGRRLRNVHEFYVALVPLVAGASGSNVIHFHF